MIRSVCCHPGCNHIALQGKSKCEEHFVERKIKKDTKKTRDKNYGTSRWKKLRAEKLRQSPLCSDCKKPANTVHHIIPVKEGGEFWDINNLDTLCRACHEKEHGSRWKQETAKEKAKRLDGWKSFLNEDM